jgi:hypothetical protein
LFPLVTTKVTNIVVSSTGDEIVVGRGHAITLNFLDSQDGPPYASIKIFYRPRGRIVVLSQIPNSYCIQSY